MRPSVPVLESTRSTVGPCVAQCPAWHAPLHYTSHTNTGSLSATGVRHIGHSVTFSAHAPQQHKCLQGISTTFFSASRHTQQMSDESPTSRAVMVSFSQR